MKRWMWVGLQIGLLGTGRTALAQSFFKPPSLASKVEEEPAEEEVERLKGEQLRARFPSLELRAEPRSVQGSIGVGTNGLYLPGNFEATLDLYPWPWLRIGLVYALGFSFKWNEIDKRPDVVFGQYGEAAVGGRIWSRHSEAHEDLQLRHSIGGYGVALPGSSTSAQNSLAEVVPVSLPSSHQLFIEGGALTGFVGLTRCLANCRSDVSEGAQVLGSVTRQLLIPFAGLRYVYYSEAVMARPSIQIVRYGQVFVDVLAHAFNAPSGDTLYLNGHLAGHPPVGLRVGGVLPVSPFCIAARLGMDGVCAEAGASLGYLPFPDFALLELHIRFPLR